jgi:hypothetical protein
MADVKNALKALDRLEFPVQWEHVRARTPGPPPVAPGRSRVIAAAVAFAVFLGAGLLVWTTFRPSTVERPVAPIGPTPAGIEATIPLGGSAEPGFGSSVAAVGSGSLWIVSQENAELLRIDTASNRIVARIPAPGVVSVAYGEGAAWVTTDSGELWMINPETDSVVDRVEASAGWSNVAVSAGRVWVGDATNGEVIAIDPATLEVAFAKQVGYRGGDGLLLAASDDSVWVWSYNTGLSRVDAVSGVVDHFGYRIDGRSTGDRIHLAAGEGAIWLTSQSNGEALQVDSVSKRVVGSWRLAPEGVASGPGLEGITAGDGVAWATWTSYRRVPGTTNERESVVHLVRLDPVTGRAFAVRTPALGTVGPPWLVSATDASLWWIGSPDVDGRETVLYRTAPA